MHIESGILHIAFGFSLFGLLVYKMRTLIRAYVIPYLLQQRQALRRRYGEIIEKKQLIITTMSRLEHAINEQKNEFVLLEKKVHLWHSEHSKKIQDQLDEREMLQGRLKEKRLLQEELLTEQKLAQESGEHAFTMATQQLREHYEGAQGRELLSDYINRLSQIEKDNA